MSIARSITRSSNRSIGSHAGGGIPRTGLIWYAKAPGMVDSIGLSASELWAALPAEHRSIYLVDENTLRSAEDIITNIEASEYLNDGGELVGTEVKGYAQYEDGTAQTVLDIAYKYFGFYLGPMVFWFASALDVEPSATNIESSVLTIPKIIGSKSYTVTGGTASKNSEAYGASGSVVTGDTIKLRGDASSDFETTATVTLSFTDDDSTFSIITRSAVTTPTAFSFTDVTGVEPATLTESDAITIAGIEIDIPISITGGEYSINSGAYTSTTGTVSPDDSVTVRATSATFDGVVNVVLTAGGVSDTFSITTRAAVTTPDAFSFTDVTEEELETLTESAAITIAGIDVAVAFTVTGGEAEKNDSGTWTTSGTVVATDTVKVRATSSASYETAINVVLDINGVSDTFTITTKSNGYTLSDSSFFENDPLSITIANSEAALIDYQVDVDLSFVSGMAVDFSGLRFTSSDGETVIPHFVSEYVSSTSATAVVLVPSLTGSGNTTIYCYYGGTNADTSNPQTVYNLYDDFESFVIDAARWETSLYSSSTAKPFYQTTFFTKTGGVSGQGVAADADYIYLAKNNGVGVDGLLYKYNYAGDLQTDFGTSGITACPEHGCDLDIRLDHDTIIASNDNQYGDTIVWEINKSTGAKIREWDFTSIDDGGCLVAYKAENTFLVFTTTSPLDHSFKITEVTVNDNGTWVEGDSWTSVALGVPQAIAWWEGQVYYSCSTTAGPENIIILDLETNGSITVVSEISPAITSGEIEGIGFVGSSIVLQEVDGKTSILRHGVELKTVEWSSRYAALRSSDWFSAGHTLYAEVKMSGNYPAVIAFEDKSGTDPTEPDNLIALGHFSSVATTLYQRSRVADVQTQITTWSGTNDFTNFHTYELKRLAASAEFFRDGTSLGSTSSVPIGDLYVSFGGNTASNTVGLVVTVRKCYVRKAATSEPVATVA